MHAGVTDGFFDRGAPQPAEVVFDPLPTRPVRLHAFAFGANVHGTMESGDVLKGMVEFPGPFEQFLFT